MVGDGAVPITSLDREFKSYFIIFFKFLPPATKLGQGNIFTGVCDSVQKGKASASVHAGIHPPGLDRHP